MTGENTGDNPRRVLLKLSGEAFGGGKVGIDTTVIRRIAEEIVPAVKQGVQVAIVVGGGNFFRGAELQQAGIDHFFDYLLGGDVLSTRKPDPAPLLHVCKQLQIAPERTLMIGDSRNDIDAARAAVICSVGLTYGYNHGEPIEETDPDWVMDKFSQLADLLLVKE